MAAKGRAAALVKAEKVEEEAADEAAEADDASAVTNAMVPYMPAAKAGSLALLTHPHSSPVQTSCVSPASSGGVE